ncbi:hypothetical protein GCM10010488_38740 [Oerskovia jenensis]|uniref:Uncharacterized protein n=1 Tax=Oerskovia jenensis TaxID=162169 RepID=A0ABS2LE95_9CELL|nr:hypothetical protein [Oerskovia jenensis]
MQGVLRATEEDITSSLGGLTNCVRMAGDRTHSFRSHPLPTRRDGDTLAVRGTYASAISDDGERADGTPCANDD